MNFPAASCGEFNPKGPQSPPHMHYNLCNLRNLWIHDIVRFLFLSPILKGPIMNQTEY
jgi:hypothetical protein